MKLDLMSEVQTGTPPAGATKTAERPSPAPASASGAASTAPAATGGVTVKLSQQSQALAAPDTGGETFDSKKVETIKNAIANGSFQVNAQAIADKLLSNAGEMLGAARR